MALVYRLWHREIQTGTVIVAPNGEEYVVFPQSDGSGMIARPLSEAKWYPTAEAAIEAEVANPTGPPPPTPLKRVKPKTK